MAREQAEFARQQSVKAVRVLAADEAPAVAEVVDVELDGPERARRLHVEVDRVGGCRIVVGRGVARLLVDHDRRLGLEKRAGSRFER